MLAALFVPNLLWTKRKPQGYDRQAAQENRVLQGLERVGQVFVTALSLIFEDFNLRPWQPWNLWLLGAAALMLLYELYWVCYFRSPRTLEDFYSNFCGVPLAGATLPVAAFCLLAVYGKNPLIGRRCSSVGRRPYWRSLGSQEEDRRPQRRIKNRQVYPYRQGTDVKQSARSRNLLSGSGCGHEC